MTGSPDRSATLALPGIAATIISVNGFSFGKTLTKLERMIGDPLCNAQLLAGVISADPMITARIIGRANAGRGPDSEAICQLSTAITRLGLATVEGILRQTHHVSPNQRRPMACCWALANATAVMTRTLADLCKQAVRETYQAEVLHIAGLLHDLGSIIVIDRFRDQYHSACTQAAESDLSLSTALQQQLGLQTGGIGMIAASSWCLPKPLRACIRYHAHPQRARHDQPLVALVHLARGLVQACGFLLPGQEFVEAIDGSLLGALGLRSADLETAIRVFFADLADLELYEGALAPA